IEFAVETGHGDWRLYIGVADVDSEVPKGSAIDAHAAEQTTTVYTGAVIFPMIPTELSAGATSLFESAERKSVVVEMIVGVDGTVTDIEKIQKNVATDMIEDFMIAANASVAVFLESHDVSSLRRIVRSPERWERIVELARQYGKMLPSEPDPVALHDFMVERRAADPDHFPDLSLAIVKLLGPGEYILD